MKIAILGYSGSGKSTLAQKLGSRFHLPVLHMDQINFLPGWIERDRNELRASLECFLENDNWVIDGNYFSFCLERRLEESDQIILMLFPKHTCFLRILKRYLQNRNSVRDSSAPGCEEKIDFEFLKWIFIDGRTTEIRARYNEIAAGNPDKTVILKNQRQLNHYLKANSI